MVEGGTVMHLVTRSLLLLFLVAIGCPATPPVAQRPGPKERLAMRLETREAVMSMVAEYNSCTNQEECRPALGLPGAYCGEAIPKRHFAVIWHRAVEIVKAREGGVAKVRCARSIRAECVEGRCVGRL